MLTAAFGVAFVNIGKIAGKITYDNWLGLVVLLYMGAAILWIVGCFYLAKAKGYDQDRVGGMFLLLFVLGCIIPVAPCIFPIGVLFLKDKARRHVRRRRDDPVDRVPPG
jgi:biotin transporter BioY